MNRMVCRTVDWMYWQVDMKDMIDRQVEMIDEWMYESYTIASFSI
jgi:hypothetical protein